MSETTQRGAKLSSLVTVSVSSRKWSGGKRASIVPCQGLTKVGIAWMANLMKQDQKAQPSSSV